MTIEMTSAGRFRWAIIYRCSIACALLAVWWGAQAQVVALAAGTTGMPVAAQRSCAGSGIGTYGMASQGWTGAQMSGAQLSLNRVEGPPGTQIALAGRGWPAGAGVTIDLIGLQPNGQRFVGQAGIARATAGHDGSFHTGIIAAPYQHSCVGAGYGEPGTIVYYVASTTDKQVVAEARFRYLPAATMQVLANGVYGQNVTPGMQLTITGQHWEPGIEVTVSATTQAHVDLPPGGDNAMTPRADAVVRARTDAAGSFQASSRMPVDLVPRTAFLLTASGIGPRFGMLTAPGVTLLALPMTMPTLALDRSEGLPGGDVQLAGAHWVPGDVVQLEYCRDETGAYGMTAADLRCDPYMTQGLGETRVGQDGHFQARVTMPAAARPGVVMIQARVVGDIFGMMVYARAQKLTIVPPTVPWTTEHPRLARMAEVASGVVALLAMAALAVWLRKRGWRRAAEAG